MIPESSPDETPDETTDNAQLRAIFWGRIGRRAIDDSYTVPKNHSWNANSSTKPDQNDFQKQGLANRPTSLTCEWKELVRMRESEGSVGDSKSVTRNYHQSKFSVWKNFVCLCTSLMLASMSFLPLRNIQTSLYTNNKLGCISLASIYGSFIIGCVFSPSIVQNSKPKSLIMLALLSHVTLCTVQSFPRLYTLVPASCAFGFLQASLWSLQEQIIAGYATQYSAVLRIKIERSIQQFQWVFVIFCHSAQILGNLMESVVLGLLNRDIPNSCEHNNISNNVEMRTLNDNALSTHVLYLQQIVAGNDSMCRYYAEHRRGTSVRFNDTPFLQIIFSGLALLSFFLLAIGWNKPDIIVNKRKFTFVQNIRLSFSFVRTSRFALLVFLMIFSGMQQGIVIGDVTMVSYMFANIVHVLILHYVALLVRWLHHYNSPFAQFLCDLFL